MPFSLHQRTCTTDGAEMIERTLRANSNSSYVARSLGGVNLTGYDVEPIWKITSECNNAVLIIEREGFEHLFINCIYTKEEARGKGLASNLLHRLCTEADESDVQLCLKARSFKVKDGKEDMFIKSGDFHYLESFHDSPDFLIPFYESFGFAIADSEKRLMKRYT
jgi:GNAT superfamily N-acetyltransferase